MPNQGPVKFFKCRANAATPKYQTPGAAGFDLSATHDLIIPPGMTAVAQTGLKFEIPEGFELQIRQRSGLSLRTKLRMANAPATIDSDFRGEVEIILENVVTPAQYPQQYEQQILRFKAGERIAQGIIAPVVQGLFEEVADVRVFEIAVGRKIGDKAARYVDH